MSTFLSHETITIPLNNKKVIICFIKVKTFLSTYVEIPGKIHITKLEVVE